MIRLAVRVRRERCELVLAELLELVPAGLEERELPGDLVEYALYGPPDELPGLPRLRAAVGQALVEVDAREVPDDWSERWRSFHRPILISVPASIGPDLQSVPAGLAAAHASRQLHIRPPWAYPCGLSGALEVVIDPGQAFGTGAHDTTRLCLELLLAVRREDPREFPLLDVGTGSGVLAIAARVLGFKPVCGFDYDPESISAARVNAAANGAIVHFQQLDLRSETIPGLDARPVIAANLLRGLLLELASRLPLAPAHLIAGGLLAAELDEASEAFRSRLGLCERTRLERGGWGALWLTPAPSLP